MRGKYDEQVLRLWNLGQHSQVSIAKIVGIGQTGVSAILKRNGVIVDFAERRNLCSGLRKGARLFDDLNNQELAYWLGFSYADGGIDGEHSLSFCQSQRDHEHLQILGNMFDVTAVRGEYFDKRIKKVLKRSTLKISITYLVRRLIKLGFEGKTESNNFKWEEVPVKSLSHFLRGYFDGDGCASFGRNNVKRLVFSSSTESFLEDVRDKISQIVGVRKMTISPVGKHCFNTEWSTEVVQIRDWLYYEATTFLRRKYARLYRED